MDSFFLDRDMAARHRARASSIHIIKVECIPASKCRRPHVKQFHVSHVTSCHVQLCNVLFPPVLGFSYSVPIAPSCLSWSFQEEVCSKKTHCFPMKRLLVIILVLISMTKGVINKKFLLLTSTEIKETLTKQLIYCLIIFLGGRMS